MDETRQRRAGFWLLLAASGVASGAGCGAGSAQARGAPPMPPKGGPEVAVARDPALAGEPLPAGLYFGPGRYEASVFTDADDPPPAPGFAVVTAAVADGPDVEADLSAALARARGPALAPGYPLIAAAGDLAVVGEGSGEGEGSGAVGRSQGAETFLVVAGLYADAAAAEAARARLGPGAALVALGEVEPGRGILVPSRRIVVQLDADARAWSTGAIAAIESELDELLGEHWVPLAKQRARRRDVLARAKPVCTAAAGAFVTTAEALYRFRRAFAPVRCPDGQVAWVPWTQTRVETVIYRASEDWVWAQVILVECDQATIERFRLHPGGERTSMPALPSGGGC